MPRGSAEPTPYQLLEALEDPQERIDAVAEDLASGARRFAEIDPESLGELLEVYFEDAADSRDWQYMTLAQPMALADAGFTQPFAENLDLLEDLVPAKRYAELCSLAEALGEDEDLPLTPQEQRLLEHAYAEEHAEDGMTFGLARTTVEATDGTELRFEVTVGDAGDLEDLKGPYDEARFTDPDDYLEIG